MNKLSLHSNERSEEKVGGFIDLASLKFIQLLRNTISVSMMVSSDGGVVRRLEWVCLLKQEAHYT